MLFIIMIKLDVFQYQFYPWILPYLNMTKIITWIVMGLSKIVILVQVDMYAQNVIRDII